MLPDDSIIHWNLSETDFCGCNDGKDKTQSCGKHFAWHEEIKIERERERLSVSQQQGYTIWLGAKTETVKKRLLVHRATHATQPNATHNATKTSCAPETHPQLPIYRLVQTSSRE